MPRVEVTNKSNGTISYPWGNVPAGKSREFDISDTELRMLEAGAGKRYSVREAGAAPAPAAASPSTSAEEVREQRSVVVEASDTPTESKRKKRRNR